MKVRFLYEPRQVLPDNKTNRQFFITACLALLVAAALVLVAFLALPPQVPLFYSRPWGQDQLAAPFFLFLPILAAAVFLIGNSLLAAKLAENFLKKALLGGAALAALLSAVTVVRILLLII